jgi:polyisoprenoid-binding protein YceI
MQLRSFLLTLTLMAPSVIPGQVPTFQFNVAESKVGFQVKASVEIKGVFEKWDASLKFSSPEVESGVLEIIAQADSVNAGSSMKEGKLKGDDFFAAKQHPQITFRSKKITQTGPDNYQVEGDFTIRGVSKQETLNLHIVRDRPDEGRIQGQMAFDRKQYGMTHGIPFIKIADRVQVDVDLKVRRIGGKPLNTKSE